LGSKRGQVKRDSGACAPVATVPIHARASGGGRKANYVGSRLRYPQDSKHKQSQQESSGGAIRHNPSVAQSKRHVHDGSLPSEMDGLVVVGLSQVHRSNRSTNVLPPNSLSIRDLSSGRPAEGRFIAHFRLVASFLVQEQTARNTAQGRNLSTPSQETTSAGCQLTRPG